MTGGIAIGIDVGTSGVRAALVDQDANALAFGSARLDDAARRDPLAWWAASQAALAALGRDLSAVRAIAVDGTSGTILGIGPDGTPLSEGSMYNDRAAPDAVRAVAEVAPATSAAHGATSPLARMLALQTLPGVARILHQADWIAGKFTGQFATTDENNALKTGYDPVSRRWPDWMALTGAREALLPDVVAPGTVTAPIDTTIADQLGLPHAARVVAGTTDGCAAFLATGATNVGDGVSSLGTTLTVKQLSDRPLFAPEFGLYSHRLGDRWLAGGASNSGGAALAQFFDGATLAALSARIDPATPSALDYYPLPAPGERFPIADPALPPRMTPRPADDAEFLAGLLEGIARIEALAYARLAELGGPGLASLRSVGGGSHNATWTAIRARVLGAPMLHAASEEAAVGVARLALDGLTHG